MKLCKSCGVSKPESDFYRTKPKGESQQRYTVCRVCMRAQKRDFYATHAVEQRLRIQAIKKKNRVLRSALVFLLKDGAVCCCCGKTYPAVAMDFDHIDPKLKRRAVSQLVGRHTVSLSYFFEEIRKCRITCSNCHRVRSNPGLLSPASQALLTNNRQELLELLKSNGLALGSTPSSS